MFEICSHSRARYAPAASVLFALLAALLLAACGRGPRLDTTEGRCAYLASCGFTALPESEELSEIAVPERFDAIWEDYNSLQLSRGFDLRAAAGETCLRACYDLADYPGWDGRVIATLYLFRGKVIGGDIHTASAEGFLLPLR